MIASRRKDRWPLVPLGTLAEFRNGVNFSKANFGTGIKVIGVGDFKNNVSASFDNLEQINPKGVVRKEHLLKDGDVLFVRSNGNRDLIGRSMFVDGLREEITHSAFSIRLRFVSEDCHPRFYAYLFRSHMIRQALSLHGGGTNISNLNQDILGRLQVPLPPKSIQCKIASILSAYDDLIENNTRRITILDKMAKMIYREWFVNFRPPGHEKAKVVESEMGPIPSGWKIKTIGEIATVKGGKRLARGKSVVDGPTEHPYVRVKDMCEWGVELSDIKYIDEETHRPISRYTITSKEIYISIAGTIGRVGIVPTKISGANLTENAAKISDVKEISQHLLLSYLRSPTGQHQIASKVVGTSQPKLALFRIEEIKVPVPPKDLQHFLTPWLSRVHDQTERLQGTNLVLHQTRDLLLPKLISGESVSVEQFETEAVAQGV